MKVIHRDMQLCEQSWISEIHPGPHKINWYSYTCVLWKNPLLLLNTPYSELNFKKKFTDALTS